MQANQPQRININSQYLSESQPHKPYIPIELFCPLTKKLMKDPVIIETGRTFERAAIMVFFQNEGLIEPFTRKVLLTPKCI